MSRFPPSSMMCRMGDTTANSSRLPLPKKPRINNNNINSLTNLRQAAYSRFPHVTPPQQDQEESQSEESEGTISPSRSRSSSAEQEEEEDDEVQQEGDNVQPSEAASPHSGDVILSNPRVLDCPKCLIPLTPPVYECQSGHFICYQCSNITRKKCPSCSRQITNNRCLGIEMVLESAKTPCQNVQRGCKAKLSYGRKQNHEKYCDYAPCSCPVLGCNYVNIRWDLYTHFGDRHSNTSRTFCFNSTARIILGKDEKQVFLQDRMEKILFVLNRSSVALGSLINVICIEPCCSPASARYSYELTANYGGKKIMLKSSVDSTPKLIAAQSPKENGLVITNGFANMVGELRLELIIRRC